MKTSQNGLEFITRWEGVVLNPYLDVASLWTIGVGHLIKPTDSFSTISNTQVKELLSSKDKNHPASKLSITRSEALEILANDVTVTEAALLKAIKVPLSQNQFDALISFGFNCGPGVFKTSAACRAVTEGKMSDVPELLLQWSKVRIGGELKTNKGLFARRTSEGELFARASAAQVGNNVTVLQTKEMIIDMQSRLKKLGLYTGVLDGILGPASKKGITEYSKKTGISLVTDPRLEITNEWLSALIRDTE